MLRRTRAIIVFISAFLMLLCQARSASAQAPTALFDVNDSIVCVGNIVSFTDNSIPGGAAITNWSWDYGDLNTSTLQNPTHSYSVGGNYLVTLIVTDALNNKDTITHTIYVLLAKAIQNTVRICSPQNATSILAVDPNITGVTGTWFTASSAIIASPNNDTTAVSNLVSGTYLFFWVVSDGTCSDADQVTIIVDQPVTTNAGPDQNICSSTGTATMGATNPSPGTGLWTTSSTATIANPPSRTSTITGLTAPGTYVFVWTTTNGSCVARDTMQIVVSSPIAANAGIDQSVCNSNPTSTLAGNNPSPGTGQWTTSGTSVITTPSSASSGVTGLANGVNTFIWTITNGTCITKDTMLITVSTLKVSNAGNDIQVCTSTGNGTLNGNNPSPGTGTWTALNGGTITSPTSSTTTVTGLSVVGFYNFVWTITNGACISRDTITIIVKSPVIANAGVDQSFCNVTTTTLIGNNPSPGTAAWTTTSTATITSPASATTTISNLPIGNSTFIYSTSFGACISRDTIIVHVDSLIIANAGPDQQVCQSNPNVTLAANNPSPATGIWTKINGGTITTPSSFNTTVTGIPAGINLFVWTVTNGSCLSTDTVKITVNVQIPSTAGLDDEICQGSVTSLSANNPSPAIGLWTTTSIATIATPTSPSSSVSGFLNSGIYSFIWTVTNGACVLSDTVRITVDSSIIANAGTDKVLCNLSTTTVSANNPSPGIGQWTSLGSATITNANNASTTVSNLTIGNNLFVWTITNSICVSSDTINIKRDTLISSNAGVDKQVCVGSPATITGNNPTPGTGLWTALSGGVITSPSSATTTITGLNVAGTYNFVWTITNGTCTSKDTVALVVNQNVIATAGADQLLCNVTTATLAGNNPSPGVGVWTTTSSAVITLASNPLTTVTGLTTGTYNFIWTITNGLCISSDTVKINVDSIIIANAGTDKSICATLANTTLNGNDPLPANGIWTTNSSAVISNPTSFSTSVNGLINAGNYSFVWTITNGVCISSDTVTIVVDSNVVANAGPDQQLCETQTTTTMSANVVAVGVGVWSTTSGAGITDVLDPLTSISGLTIGTQQFVWTVTNNSCEIADTINITVAPQVTASNAGLDGQFCASINGITIKGNDPLIGIGTWTSLGSAIVDTALTSSTTVSNLSIGQNLFVWTISNGSCSSSDTVSITSNPNPIVNAGLDQFTTSGTPVNIGGSPTATSGTSPYSYVWNPGVTLNDSLVSNPTATVLFTQTFNISVTDSLGCIGTDTVVVYVNNPPSATNDTIITNEDSVTVIVALANDTDPDNNINPGSLQVLNGPFHGVAIVNVITGAITYTPALNYFGLDSINYAICDSGIPIYCDTAWIYINVLPINDAPIAVDDTVSTPEDSCIQIAVLLNDFDVENGIQLSSLAILSGPNHGIITIDTLTGIITYCPDSNFTSIDTLTYIICDNGTPIYCDTALVIITIIPRNDAPIAINDTITLCSVDSVVYDVLFNDIDPEGDSLFVTILSGPFHGTAVVTSAQQIGYGSTAFYNGVDSILYQVCDNGIPSRCDTATMYVIVHATPQVSSSILNNRCFNDSLGAIDITVLGNSPFNILWSNSQKTQDIDSLPSGIYTLNLIDSFGCSVAVDDTVTGPLSPLSALLSLQPVLCHGDSTGAIDLQPQGGTIPYTFVWSNADTTEDISGLLAGIYSVMISDSNGCKLSLTDSILQPDSSLSAGLVVTNIKCAGDSTGAIALTVLGGTPTYTYLWSNSSNNQNISNALSGIYTVTITDLFSCSVTISDTIKSLNSAIVANLSVVNPYCLGAVLGSISSNPTGGNSPYSFIWSTSDTLNVIDSLSAGNYFLQITDSVGCLQNDTIALVDTSSINISNAGSSIICSGSSATLSVASYPNISYLWSLNGSNLPNDTLNHLTATQAGNYSVQATSLCGIYSAGPLLINVNALPMVTVSPGSTIACDSIITINASGGSNYSWTPANLCNTPNSASTNVNPQTSTIFFITVSDNIGCSTIDSVIVNVTCDTIFVPTGFSPNGDGVNDYFVISNLNRYPDAVLKIFNRWGDIVYEKDHYDNSWEGLSNIDGIRISKELPNGTYYFIFEPGNNESTKAGYVILRR